MVEVTGENLYAENQRLKAELEEVRLKLDEAEQALEAIRTGQVESLVVEGPEGPRIFSLEGADHAYRVLVEAMNEGAATFGEDGTILYCNARFAEMLDAPLETVMGTLIRQFLPARSHVAFLALLREAEGGESRGELDLLNHDGRPVPALVSVSVINDDSRCRYCLVAADLRAQKRNEEILAAERFAGSVLEQAADAILVCGADGRIIRASESAVALCSCNPLFRPFEQALPLELGAQPGDGNEANLLARAMRDESVRAVPASLNSRDGRNVELLASAATLRDPENRVVGYVITLADVTELRESEARFRSVLTESRDVIYRYNVQTRRFEYLSPSVRAVVGFSSEELMALDEQASQAMIHPEDLPEMEAALERLERTGKAEAEYRQRSRKGDYRWLSNRMSLVRDSLGRPLYRNGNIRDITERKLAEQAVRAANLKLAEADQRKNRFLAVLSHELRNPLAPIKNSLYVLERATPGGDQARRALDVIDRQSDQLARLVDDLLDVTRITSNKIHLQRRRLELNELVRRTLDDYRSLFDNGEISLELKTTPTPIYVNADWNRMAQVIGNLLQNAAKFTGRAGLTRVSVEEDQVRGQAVIRVTDTGVGMPPALLSRLFEPFAQADETLDRSKGGLGLGLALVKGLVELHGGNVAAHSEGVGKGAEFVVRFPLESPELAQVEAPRQAAQHACRRILIIEDNVDAANSLSEVLGFTHHQVAVAFSGPEGLDKAREFHPEVVLCDIGLPGMNGYEVARTFRADAGLRDVYLVALTGYALPEDLQQAQQAGFQRHLAKPPSLDKLEALLANLPTPDGVSGSPTA